MTPAELARAIMDEVPTNVGKRGAVDARLLALLVALDDGDITVGQVSETLGISQASASELIDKAEAAGWVQRWVARVDGRLRLVALTEQGNAMRQRRRGAA